MIIQEALKSFSKLSLEDAATHILMRKESEFTCIKMGIDTHNNTGLVIFDADEQEKFFKNGETWVSLRMEDILAEDWEIVKDE